METEQLEKERTPESLAVLRRESVEIWDANAGVWDDYMGDAGNDFHRELVAPSAERLLALRPGETVLEIGCGAGLFARRMAELGARVLATDFSSGMLERAKARTAAVVDRIELRRVDATDPDELASLGEGRFDAAVSNMALMDMIEVAPLFAALTRLVKPGGRFVFTLCHPCFNTTGCTRMVEQTDADGELRTVYSIKVSRYKGLAPTKGLGIHGQPRPQYYFDRTLSDLLGTAFRAGWVMDAIEEPAFEGSTEGVHHLSTRHYREIPLVLAARMRLLEQR